MAGPALPFRRPKSPSRSGRAKAGRLRFILWLCVAGPGAFLGTLAALQLQTAAPSADAANLASIALSSQARWAPPTSGPGAVDALRARFGFCHSGGGTNCVVDGDTFWFAGQKYRIADIDAPETHPARCPAEAALGARSTKRLQQWLNDGAFALESIDRDADRYGRKLRIVTRDGNSAGAALVAEGLARPWEGNRRPWC